ncbi:hypothetical protein [Weissella confusa]|uniref:Uncharacterized protein n=1 Tax=Weissella confusa TaxID=1583 RepID=A0A4Z0RZ96_WEICO|nr:hypothetical protein [Weissella confusa]TGE73183.1 hypothetical protein C6P11_04820 [Weissella confusa]
MLYELLQSEDLTYREFNQLLEYAKRMRELWGVSPERLKKIIQQNPNPQTAFEALAIQGPLKNAIVLIRTSETGMRNHIRIGETSLFRVVNSEEDVDPQRLVRSFYTLTDRIVDEAPSKFRSVVEKVASDDEFKNFGTYNYEMWGFEITNAEDINQALREVVIKFENLWQFENKRTKKFVMPVAVKYIDGELTKLGIGSDLSRMDKLLNLSKKEIQFERDFLEYLFDGDATDLEVAIHGLIRTKKHIESLPYSVRTALIWSELESLFADEEGTSIALSVKQGVSKLVQMNWLKLLFDDNIKKLIITYCNNTRVIKSFLIRLDCSVI